MVLRGRLFRSAADKSSGVTTAPPTFKPEEVMSELCEGFCCEKTKAGRERTSSANATSNINPTENDLFIGLAMKNGRHSPLTQDYKCIRSPPTQEIPIDIGRP